MAFWKPGEKTPGAGVDRDLEKEPQFAIFNPNAKLSITQQRLKLPIFQNSIYILFTLVLLVTKLLY